MTEEEPEVLKEWSVASPVLFLIPSLSFSQANKTPLRPLDPSRLQGINCGPDFTPSFANLGRPALSNRGPPRGGPGGELPRGPVSGSGKGCAGGVGPCISLRGGEKSALEMWAMVVVVLTNSLSFVPVPCLAGWPGTPAISAGPPKGTTQDHCHSVNDRRYKAEQSRKGLETQ